jgi:Fur family ferric uptake transcriptional regulator
MASATSFPRQQPLLQLLQQTDGELSAQELHQRLRATRHSTGLATVYRVLKQLQQAGLVRCRKLPSGEAVYAPVDRDEHHLTCVKCGHLQALPLCPMSSGSLGLGAVLLQGFRPLFHTFEIHGLCRRCQQHEIAETG